MARILLSGFRLRIGDENFNPPDTTFPYRLVFTDSTTTSPKTVYNGPDLGASSLGGEVNLDAQGYVPPSGVWLDEGRYNIQLQKRVSTGPDVWEQIWTINKVQGNAAGAVASDDTTIRFVETIAAIRALSGADLGGMTLNTGYYALADGGQGSWRWNSTSMATDDGGATLIPTTQSPAVPGRWIRIFETGGEVSVKLWGAVSSDVLDVSGNILLADAWCARTSDDTAITLVFPAGKYRIGSSITLDGSGLTEGAVTKLVQYHVYDNAFFSATGLYQVIFKNKVQIDSTSVVSPLLFVNEVEGSEVDPRWWGADNTGVADSGSMFNNMLNLDGSIPAHGANAIAIKGSYLLNSEDLSTLAADQPTYKFYKGGLLTLGVSLIDLTIGTIDHVVGNGLILDGSIGLAKIYNFDNVSSWFNLTGTASLINVVTALSTAQSQLRWDAPFTFDAGYDDISTELTHVLDGQKGIWFLNNYDVKIHNARLADDKVFFFALTSNVGTINIANTYTLKASWFGFSLQNIINSVNLYSWDVDFQGFHSTISGFVALKTSFVSTLRIRNWYLTGTGTDLLTIDATDHSTYIFDNCEFTGSGVANNLFTSNAKNITFNNCRFTTGIVTLIGESTFIAPTEVKGCIFTDSELHIYSTLGLQRVIDNKFTNCQLHLYSTQGVLRNFRIKGNDFAHDSLAGASTAQVKPNDPLNDGFIRLNSTGTEDLVNNVVISDNTYDNQNKSDVYVQNVYDATDGVTFSWIDTVVPNVYDPGALHDITIKNENCGQLRQQKQMAKKFEYMRVCETEGSGSTSNTNTGTWQASTHGLMRLVGVLSSTMGVTALASNNEAGGSYYYQAERYQPAGATPPDGQASFNSNGDSSGRSLNFLFVAKL